MLTLADLRGYLRDRLSDHQLPDQLLRVPRWPLTAVGKIDKRQLALAAQRAQRDPGVSRQLTIARDPLDVLYHLLDGEVQNHIAYERHGTWYIGLGTLAQIALYADRAELTQGDAAPLQWRGEAWQANLQQALAALPFSEWRAFGVSHFELSGLIHQVNLDRHGSDAPLLTLFVPQAQIVLAPGSATIAARSAQALSVLADRLRAADRPADIDREESDWQAHVAQCIREQNAQAYCQQVAAAVAEIQRGAYQKVILSRRITLDAPVDLLASYHLGRRHNTPARSYVVKLDQQQFVGFSPETVVEVSSAGAVSSQPLAGTRALTHDEAENRRLRDVLTSDTKEIAEHAVSVKLALEELTPLCVEESAHVSDFMRVSLRGSVQHLASRVKGQLTASATPWHAFAALFPAVTASGIPKAPAIDAIGRLEPVARGAYSGSVFLLDSRGEMDAALVLRSLYRHGDRYALQAGAGIIDQSVPARELEETVEKLQSVSRFVVRQKPRG